MREFIWIAGAVIVSVGLHLLFRDNLVFTLVALVALARLLIYLYAEYRERKRYRELEDLDFEARRQLLDEAGEQGLVKRSPPD